MAKRERFTVNEKITLTLSALAVVISLLSIYFQFFYVSEAVTVAKLGLDVQMASTRGAYSLVIAAINSGNRDALLMKFAPRATGVTFAPATIVEPVIVKSQEIRPLTLSGTFEIDEDANNGTIPLFLSHRIVGARGYDIEADTQIGTLIIAGHQFVGDDILKFPVRIH
jgi:hypothetical protein